MNDSASKPSKVTRIEIDGDIATIIFNRPEKRNAMNDPTVQEIDRILGAVLQYADSAFNPLLELGFSTAIRREWAWRVSRGESLANLKAFEHLIS